jgi:hypothetical protein
MLPYNGHRPHRALPSRRPTRHIRRSRRRQNGAKVVSRVAIVSVVWFTSTSWRRDKVSAPYRLRKGVHFRW